MLSEMLTFLIFLLIGLEIREGLKKPGEAIIPGFCAALGMIFPALIFITLSPIKDAWAVAMPTDVALAVGALALLGKRVKPALRIFLLTLAVADDCLSLLVIAIFFRSDLHISSAIYTLGAALLGFALPYRETFIRYLTPISTFIVIPIYIWINLLSKLDFSRIDGPISTSLIVSRVVGKVVGISAGAFLLARFSSLKLPAGLYIREITGVGFLAGMGMTVSIVIAEITLHQESDLTQVRGGLFIAALISGLLGLIWLFFVDRLKVRSN